MLGSQKCNVTNHGFALEVDQRFILGFGVFTKKKNKFAKVGPDI